MQNVQHNESLKAKEYGTHSYHPAVKDIVIIMFRKVRFDSCSLYPQNEIGPSISSSVVLCVFVVSVYIVVLV